MMGGLRSAVRLLWRDSVMKLSDATFSFDEFLAAYLFRDAGYQYIWNKLEVHQTLLQDDVRMEKFKKAIDETVNEGDRVLDLGTGTGILAFMAANAGAREVVGVDSSNIIEVAEKTAKKNGFENVRFLRKDIRDLEEGGFDLIICELLGMNITDEGITYKVEGARKHVRAGGKLMPERIDIYVAPVESPAQGLGFWRTRYGIDYSAVEKVRKELRSADMSECVFLADPARIASIELGSERNPKIRFEKEFKTKRSGQFHGCVMYFSAKLSDSVTLTTHPHEKQTHWKQVFLPHTERCDVEEGDNIKVEVKAVYNNTGWRWKYRI